MESYNKKIADMLKERSYKYIHSTPQPETFQPETLYGGKRFRTHPQPGNTAYSMEPSTLIPQHSLIKSSVEESPYNEMRGGRKKYNLDSFIKDFNKVGKVLKPVAQPIISALTNKAVSKIEGAGIKKRQTKKHLEHEYMEHLEGGKHKYNVSSFVKDFNKIGKVLKPVAKPIISALTDRAVGMIEGAGIKRRGRPRKLQGGAGELYPPNVERGGALKKPNRRGELVRMVMKKHGLSLPDASKFIKQNNLS